MQESDISQLNGRILKVFLAVYDGMSVSKAAEELEISQSTVSHSLERLRSMLGDPLFLQSGRGITPSVRAEILAPRIRSLLADMEALAGNGTYHPQSDTEPFVLAANGAGLSQSLKALQSRLWDVLPGKDIVFREFGSRSSLESFLDSRSADLAIVARPGSYPKTLKHISLFRDENVVFFDPQCRQAISSIEDYCAAPHAALDFGGTSKSVVELALAEHSMARTVAVKAPNVWLLAQLMLGTKMIATLPSRLQKSAFAQLDSCPSPLALPPVHFDLVWHRRYDNSPRLHWLRDFVVDTLAVP